MTDRPWYMNTTIAEKGSPERNEKHLRSIAEAASEEADAMVSHLRAAEARGVELSPTDRMSIGYTTNARHAANQLRNN
ncbi:hypothetical protein [Streptomyces sp. NPDC048551]|uniref:hypothetical protein n=1 Tax=Streptomyces sp. NPDC048551 TaxID=3155758 RepID=UPI0034493BEC